MLHSDTNTNSNRTKQERNTAMTVMPYQDIERRIRDLIPMIYSADQRLPLDLDPAVGQIQPASFDLRLGFDAYGVRASGLPHARKVLALAEDPMNRWCKFGIDLEGVNPLRSGDTYLIPLAEELNLPPDIFAEFSPKSSTGRCDVFVRVLCDNFSRYDVTPPGYSGPLWLELTSKSHEIGIQAGLRLVQSRFKKVGTQRLTTDEVIAYHRAEGILFNQDGTPVNKLDVHDGKMSIHVDLNRNIIGYVAKDTTNGMLDMTKSDAHDPSEFWEPIRGPLKDGLVLMKDKFYLLTTEERVRIPAAICGHLLSTVPEMGELRIHYAGFFDNLFGGEKGTHAVLEVRGRDVNFKIEHAKPVGAMIFERTSSVPQMLYGQSGNSYAGDPRPALSKHFRYKHEAWEREYTRPA